jgi:hypothetical protein
MPEFTLDKLMIACDAADRVVADKTLVREEIEITLRDAAREEALAIAEARGLHRALMLVTPQHDMAAQPSPAQETKPKEPRDLCADAIAALGINTHMRFAPEDIAAELRSSGHDFKDRTISGALNLLHKRRQQSRASAQPESDAIRKEQGSPSDSAPESGGAVRSVMVMSETGSAEAPAKIADIPKFLDRREPKAAAE